MRRFIGVAALFLMVCGAAGAQSCAASAEDDGLVVGVLRTMYSAAMVNDMAKLRAQFAPGAYLFDGGKKYDSIDSLMQVIEEYRGKGVKFAWSVTQPDVHVHCNQAWVAYRNVGSVTSPGGATPLPMEWLESADLEKQDGVWKIVFFQSSRVADTAK